MADCIRCAHADDLHDPTALGGLGACTQGDGCVKYYEELLATVQPWLCGWCGAAVQDYGLHDAWHDALGS
jgi:hypothetical protein